jgi:hypothetical protein
VAPSKFARANSRDDCLAESTFSPTRYWAAFVDAPRAVKLTPFWSLAGLSGDMVPDTCEPMPSVLRNRLDLNMIRSGGRLPLAFLRTRRARAKADASWKEPNQ